MAYLRCDICGKSTTHQGSWSTPIKILCEKCTTKTCICIKKSSWYLIDDTFDKNSKIKGGKYEFELGNKYQCFEEETAFGKSFMVIHPIHGKENAKGFDKEKFFEHFEI